MFNFFRLLLNVFCSSSKGFTYLRFDHSCGGGSETVAARWIEQHSSDRVIQVRSYKNGFYLLEIVSGGKIGRVKCRFFFLNWFLKGSGIDEIIIGQFSGYDIVLMDSMISGLKQKFDCNIIYYWNDCYSLCPRYFLLDHESKYCAGGGDQCVTCYPKVSSSKVRKTFPTIHAWRGQWRNLFNSVDEIRVFSSYSARFIRSFFDDFRGDIIFEEMAMRKMPIANLRKVKDPPYNVAIMGIIGIHKGLQVLTGIDQILKGGGVMLQFHLYGGSSEDLPYFINHGPYEAENLAESFSRDSIDMVLIPSICAETFCLTAEEAMLMEVPVACFDVGAHAVRVKEYQKGLILSSQSPEVVILELYNNIKKDEQ